MTACRELIRSRSLERSPKVTPLRTSSFSSFIKRLQISLLFFEMVPLGYEMSIVAPGPHSPDAYLKIAEYEVVPWPSDSSFAKPWDPPEDHNTPTISHRPKRPTVKGRRDLCHVE